MTRIPHRVHQLSRQWIDWLMVTIRRSLVLVMELSVNRTRSGRPPTTATLPAPATSARFGLQSHLLHSNAAVAGRRGRTMVADHLWAKIVKIGARSCVTRYTVFHVPDAAVPKEMSFPRFQRASAEGRAWLRVHLGL